MRQQVLGFASIIALALGLAPGSGCSSLELDPPPTVIHARFDPDARVIPMPTDVLRDRDAGRLELPNDTPEELAALTPAEAEFYGYLETLDGWSSLMSATVELTGAIDPRSVTDGTVQVWRWGAVPERVDRRPAVGVGRRQEDHDRSTPHRLAARRSLRRGDARRGQRRRRARRRARRVRRRVLLPAPDRRRSTRRTTSARSPARPPSSGATTRAGSRRSARISRPRSTTSRTRAGPPPCRAPRSPRCGRSPSPRAPSSRWTSRRSGCRCRSS